MADTGQAEDIPIHDVYAQRLAADLAANRGRQEEVAALLERLRTEEKWLVELQAAIPGSSSPHGDRSAVPAESVPAASTPAQEAALPPQRQEPPARSRRNTTARSRSAAKKTGGSKPAVKADAKSAAADKPASKGAPRKQATKKASANTARTEPPLRSLLTGVMGSRIGEPLTVSEIRDLLERTHPARATSAQVVRNTLEVLVKKGAVERSTQKGSVMYILLPPRTVEAAEQVEDSSAPLQGI